MAVIQVENLSKAFRIKRRRPGVAGALVALVAAPAETRWAVRELSFTIEAGEIVGYIGPNGAGKSTTVKMLTGILVPTEGRLSVLALDPSTQRREHAGHIGVVFGQRTQLWWDLPLEESFDLLRAIYRIPADRYRANLKRFRALLELDEFLRTPVRQLSLGQRMRGDLAAALLHDPPVIFLDEPTIGLDVVAKERIREFLLTANREQGVTILLTTHDMGDIEKLCRRVMIIDHGRLLYDGPLDQIRDRYGRHRTLVIDLQEARPAEEVKVALAEAGVGGWGLGVGQDRTDPPTPNPQRPLPPAPLDPVRPGRGLRCRADRGRFRPPSRDGPGHRRAGDRGDHRPHLPGRPALTAYLGFAKRGFQRAITYQFQFWSELVINLLFMFIYLCVWRALYAGRASVGGYGRGQLFSYIIVSQTLITFQFTVRAWAGIEAKVRTGEIVIDLVRPIDFQGMILATAVGTAMHTLLTNMLPKFALFALLGTVQAPVSPLAAWLFPVSAVLGFLVLFGIEFLVGVLAFWLVEVRGLYALMMWGIAGLFSGYFLPLEFFPRWLGTIAHALPFAAMVYTPAAIYAGSIAGAAVLPAVLGQVAWVVALLGAGRLLFAVAHRRLVVQGG